MSLRQPSPAFTGKDPAPPGASKHAASSVRRPAASAQGLGALIVAAILSLLVCCALPQRAAAIDGSKTFYYPVDRVLYTLLGTIEDDNGAIGYCIERPKYAPAEGGTEYRSFEYATGSWAYLAEHAYPYTTTFGGVELDDDEAQAATILACWMLPGDMDLDGSYWSPTAERYLNFQDMAVAVGNKDDVARVFAAAAALVTEARAHEDWPQNNAQIWYVSSGMQKILYLPPQVTVTFTKTSVDAAATIGNSSYALEGAEYDIFLAENDELVTHVVTDKDGKASVKLLVNTNYYAVETKAPKGFLLDRERVSFSTTTEVSSVDLADKPASVMLRIQKADAATGGRAQRGCSLAGATFEVTYQKDGETQRKTITTDDNGAASLAGLPLGTVTVRETKAPAGYLVNSAPITLTASADAVNDAGVVELAPAESIKETPVAFDLEIAKYLGPGSATSSQVEHAGAGVAFDIISNTTGKTVGTIVTNDQGVADTASDPSRWFGEGTRAEGIAGALPYDPKGYTVHEQEKTVPQGFKHIDDWVIEPEDQLNGAKLQYIVSNQRLTSRLQVVKKDAETGAVIPLAGFTFQVLGEDKQPITQETWYPAHAELSSFTTDETGTVTLPEPLTTGTYYLHETKATAPYLIGKDLTFTIDAENASGEDPLVVIAYEDKQATGRAVITKRADKTRELLAGAVFDVVAQQDVVAPDGTVQAAKNEVVTQVTTGDNGMAVVDGLGLGSGSATYAFVERTPPKGYQLDATAHPFTVCYADDTTPVVDAHVEVSNTPTRITIDKHVAGTDEALSDATFELWQSEEAEKQLAGGKEVTELPDKRTTVATGTTNAQGKLTWEGVKPGTYFFCETKTHAGFVVDPTIRTFTVSAEGTISGEGFGADSALALENDYTKIDVSKRDITNEEEVPGATLSILDKDGNVIETWVSQTEPHRIERLPPGTYTLVEKITPQTYDEGNEVVFTVEETGEVQPVTFYDEPIEIAGEIDKRQEIADPVAPNVVENGDGANTSAVSISDDGLFDYALDFRSTASTWVDEFTVTDTIDAAEQNIAVLQAVTTPQACEDYDGLMNVWYTTNKTDPLFLDPSLANATHDDGHKNPWIDGKRMLDYQGWVLWRQNVSATNAQRLEVSELGLEEGERITGVRFEYGRVEKGFTTRVGQWDREDLKYAHDDEDNVLSTHSETFTLNAASEGSVPVAETITYAPAVLHMRATDRYVSDITLANDADVDLFRNGGGDKLEDHDDDHVEQTAGSAEVPLFQTGTFPIVAGTAGIACIVLIVAWLSRPRYP